MMGFTPPKGQGKTYQNMLVSDEWAKKIPSIQDSVPDEIVSKVVAAGSPSTIVERIDEFAKAGATEALIHFVGDDDENQMREFSRKILEHFHSETM